MEVAHRAPLSMGTLHTRILERVAGPSSRGSSQPKDQTQVSSIAGGFFTVWVTREAWNSNWILFDSQTLSLFTNLTTSETLGKAQHPCALVYLLPHERGIWFVLARWLLLNSRKSRKRRVEDSWEKGEQTGRRDFVSLRSHCLWLCVHLLWFFFVTNHSSLWKCMLIVFYR